jgi:hypothetical protein
MRRSDRRTGQPGGTRAQGLQHGLPVALDVASQRSLAQQMRSEQVEGAPVRKGRYDPPADTDAGRVPVEPADRGQAPARRQHVPAAQVMRRRSGGHRRSGIT